MKNNPTTEEEAYEQLKEIHPIFTNVSYEDFKDFCRPTNSFRSKTPVSLYTNKQAEVNFLSDNKVLASEACILPKKDYQALCAIETCKQTQNILLSLCVDGKKDEVDKLLLGFYDKYSKYISKSEGSKYINVEGDILQNIQKDIADNFANLHPSFYNETTNKYNQLRKEKECTSTMEISDSQFYALAGSGGKLFMGDQNSDVGKELNKYRQFYKSLVEQTTSQNTKGKMKSDKKQQKQVIKNISKQKNNESTKVNEDKKTLFNLGIFNRNMQH